MFGNPFCNKVIDHVTSSTLKEALGFKFESRKILGICRFCVILNVDHVTCLTLKKATRLKVESRKISENVL